MRVLLDECIPRKFKDHLPGHDCHTVPEVGLAGKKNGELLSLAEASGFQVLVSVDQGIEYQQNLTGRSISVVLIRARSSRLTDLLVHGPEMLEVLKSIGSGQFIHIG